MVAAVRLAERYDLSIMSTKGMSVVASRHASCSRENLHCRGIWRWRS
jgi:hypothetical protein